MSKKLWERQRILKASREKQKRQNFESIKREATHKGALIRLTADFSSETMEVSTQWDDIYKFLEEKYCQTRILYPAKWFFKDEGKIKPFLEKENWEVLLLVNLPRNKC